MAFNLKFPIPYPIPWIGGVLLALMLLALATWLIKQEIDQPTPFQPDEMFEFQLGRGSGMQGLDLFRVTSTGDALFEFQTHLGKWERKRFHVDEKRRAELVEKINFLRIMAMERSYSDPNICDGTQWCLLPRFEGKTKSVYFNNRFPDAIIELAAFVDTAILEPLAGPVASTSVPTRHVREHEKEIWASIR